MNSLCLCGCSKRTQWKVCIFKGDYACKEIWPNLLDPEATFSLLSIKCWSWVFFRMTNTPRGEGGGSKSGLVWNLFNYNFLICFTTTTNMLAIHKVEFQEHYKIADEWGLKGVMSDISRYFILNEISMKYLALSLDVILWKCCTDFFWLELRNIDKSQCYDWNGPSQRSWCKKRLNSLLSVMFSLFKRFLFRTLQFYDSCCLSCTPIL